MPIAKTKSKSEGKKTASCVTFKMTTMKDDTIATAIFRFEMNEYNWYFDLSICEISCERLWHLCAITLRTCDAHVDTLFMQFNIVLHTHFVGLLSHRIELHFDSCITFSRDLKLAANCATSGGWNFSTIIVYECALCLRLSANVSKQTRINLILCFVSFRQ